MIMKILCRCGSKSCIGYIIADDYRPELKGFLKEKIKAEKKAAKERARLKKNKEKQLKIP